MNTINSEQLAVSSEQLNSCAPSGVVMPKPKPKEELMKLPENCRLLDAEELATVMKNQFCYDLQGDCVVGYEVAKPIPLFGTDFFVVGATDGSRGVGFLIANKSDITPAIEALTAELDALSKRAL